MGMVCGMCVGKGDERRKGKGKEREGGGLRKKKKSEAGVGCMEGPPFPLPLGGPIGRGGAPERR